MTIELAALDAMRQSPGEDEEFRLFCPPDSALNGSDPQRHLARAFIAYVDRNPAVRDRDTIRLLDEAMAATWPCPR